jgi:uncharacterized MAPEG superfamily protein
MTTELTYLAATLVLAVVQILWADVARTRQYGLAWNTSPRDQEMPPLGPMAARLLRAQSNLFETLPLFIAAVLIAFLAHRTGALTLYGSALYFWARVVYVPLYAFGVPQIRSLVWLVSFAGLLMTIAALFIG